MRCTWPVWTSVFRLGEVIARVLQEIGVHVDEVAAMLAEMQHPRGTAHLLSMQGRIQKFQLYQAGQRVAPTLWLKLMKYFDQ